ncbi:hypothetical protein [Streptomyces antarcticus]
MRYYERLGLLVPAGRHGLRRTYRPEAVDRVASDRQRARPVSPSPS